MSLLSIFATAILPTVSIAAVGFFLGRFRDVDPRSLNTITVYVLAPALVFHTLLTTTLGSETLVQIAVGVAAYHFAIILVAEGVGRAAGVSEPALSALVLTSAFPNAGNFGIPVSEFAFGPTGRSTAVLVVSVQNVLIFTLGVYIASRSGGTRGLAGVRRVLEIPLVYAVVAALALRYVGFVPPVESTAMSTLKLVGDSSIPVMLLILGVQLSNTDYGATLGQVGLATALTVGVAPFVGLGVAALVGFSDPTVARTFVLECAGPAAVTPVILVTEFGEGSVAGVDVAEFVSTVVLVTTLVSVPAVTLVIALSGGIG